MARVETLPSNGNETQESNGRAMATLLSALTALRRGETGVCIPLDWTGIEGKVADAFNEVVELYERMAGELARLGQVAGKEGKLAERMSLGDVRGFWDQSVRSVNNLIADLVHPTSETARVIGAVAKGDLSQPMALDVDGVPLQGEFLKTAMTINKMVNQLGSFASEVTRVAREVGTEGKLGGQAKVPGVAGTWKDLTESVNSMASNLTSQVRNIAEVTKAVAAGDLSRKITVDVKGEVLELKNTINTMVDQLQSFASEVTRVASEVETEGKLGGQADRQKDEFLSMLAHELRNPLAPIRTVVELLRLRGSDDPQACVATDVIDRQSNHLARLVDELLDVSRITLGKIHLDNELVDLETVINASVETSRPMIDAGLHELSVSMPHEALWLNCDRVRISQVLANLLNNAAKYTPEGGKISLSVVHEAGDVIFTVRDNGIGIPAEMLSKIFGLFSQVDRSIDRSQGGLGIGLTLVKRLVELHGGSVHASSDGTGKGSQLTVTLPIVAQSSCIAAQCAEMPEPVQNSELRILVVDDNVDAAKTTAMLLTLNRHRVRMAHNGWIALDEARNFRPQVVLLDLGLPELDGYEVARRLRTAPETRDSLLVAVSGYGQEEDRRRTREAGFDLHFVKPVSTAALLRALTQANRTADLAVS